MWETQKDPYGGDVVNSYNDGPTEPGKAQASQRELVIASLLRCPSSRVEKG